MAPAASRELSVFLSETTKPEAFVAGQKQAVTRAERRRLAALAARDPEAQRMYAALAEVNRSGAEPSDLVSPACFTTYVRITGESGGLAHGVGDRPFLPTFAIPKGFEKTINQLLNEQFGPGRARLVQMASGRFDSSDEYHEIQLREKPADPNTHSNYGVFLLEKKGDLEGAEREYRKAIELNGKHVNALGNLANLSWKQGDIDQANDLYLRALEVSPGDENVTCNYARFLMGELKDPRTTRDVLDRGLMAHPESGRLLLLRAELSLLSGESMEALEMFQQARERGANQAEVEAGYACALQMNGAPIEGCIGAYRVAIALNPANGGLRLNLAQLMFTQGDDAEARDQLQEAMRLKLGDEDQLEAQFYLLSHTLANPTAIFRTMRSLLERGCRLRWNVQPNIEAIERHDPRKAGLLKLVAEALGGQRDQVVLDEVLALWR